MTAALILPLPRVLMADDNPHDIELVQLAFEELGCEIQLDSVKNGEEALRHVRLMATDAGAARPCVLLLDLNMPRVGGLEVLAFIATQPTMRSLPVVILTTSDSPKDRAACLKLGAHRYIVKAHSLPEFFTSLEPVIEIARAAKVGPPPSSPAGDSIPPAAPSGPPSTPLAPRFRQWLDWNGERSPRTAW